MPMLPVRDLGGLGIIKDINTYDLPINGVSEGNNVRFEDGKVTRSPSYREIADTTITATRHVWTIRIPGQSDRIATASDTGQIYSFLNDAEDEITPASGAITASALPYTHTLLSGVSYINRNDRIPLYWDGVVTDYTDLSNWTSTHRCKSLRAFKSYLIALNVDKVGTNYPTMVKWSDVAVYGSPPPSWDHTDPTTNAGENTIGDATTPLVDGLALRNAFVFYTTSQAFIMTESGNLDVFNFRKLFDNRGLINVNCVVEVQGLHYCFGFNDIYVHDGSSYRSIIEGRNKDFVFKSLNFQATDSCFVQHDPVRNEIIFAYQSGDGDTKFKSATDCNKKATYNYVSNTWGFGDMPNVVGMCISNIDNYRTYADMTSGYDITGGTYYELETGDSEHLFTAGPVDDAGDLTAARIYGYDPIVDGLIPYPLSTEGNADAYVGRKGMDLDEAGSELRAYMVLRGIYPQLSDFNTGGVTLQFAGTEYGETEVVWPDEISWEADQYKVDTREGGRYLSWRVNCAINTDFQLSGFDADVQQTGRR